MVDALSRAITTYVHGQFIKVEENASVTYAVNLLHSSKAETAIIVTKEAFFESVSASTNTGLSTGITNVELDSVSKSLLITNMIMGRFEIITILYIFFNFLRR
jgi:Trk-type K+ transport system membrane component